MKPELFSKLPIKGKHLVFASAGDNSNLELWLKGNKTFDLWVSYYGKRKVRFKDNSQYYLSKKGGKFPGLAYCYAKWPHIIEAYDSIMVMDDDLIISASEISELFRIREIYGLWLLQPAFDRSGKVSHKITQAQAFNKLRFTNFVEITSPMFSMSKFKEFMQVYDSELNCWGVDIWYSSLFSLDDKENNKIAIIDEISCVNPLDRTKKGKQREIDKLLSDDDRIATWKKIQNKYSLKESIQHMEFGKVRGELSSKKIVKGIRITSLAFLYGCYKLFDSIKSRVSL